MARLNARDQYKHHGCGDYMVFLISLTRGELAKVDPVAEAQRFSIRPEWAKEYLRREREVKDNG